MKPADVTEVREYCLNHYTFHVFIYFLFILKIFENISFIANLLQSHKGNFKVTRWL